MNRTFSSAITVQGRVLWALCLREIHNKRGKFRLGYLWQLIKTGFSVATFWWIREAAGFQAPQGLPAPIFLLMGFVPWHIFQDSLSMTMEAVRTNRALLTFPQITPLDLYASSALIASATEFVVMTIFLMCLSFGGYNTHIYNMFIFLSAFVGVALLGFGMGLVLSVLSLYFSAIAEVVPMVMRILFLTSGVFFSPSEMAVTYGSAIMWIPTANFIELLRGVFLGYDPHPLVKVDYIVWLTAIFLVLGLLLERHARPQQESAS